MTRLICSELTKAFSNQIGINDVNVDLEFNGLGLLGPNGSGKTTFIKLLLGIITPTTGSIRIDVPRSDIRVVSDQPALPEKMTIDEWVYTLESMFGHHIQGIDIQTDLGLEGQWVIRNLSSGQRRKAALLPAFYGKPQLIILDEPSNYLDIPTRAYILKLLKTHSKITGADIIISSHNVDEIRLFANDVFLLKDGILMRNIKIDNQSPEFFEIQASDMERLQGVFQENNVNFSKEETMQGNVLKVKPMPSMWKAIEIYQGNGGFIHSFKAIDALERMIEDLTK